MNKFKIGEDIVELSFDSLMVYKNFAIIKFTYEKDGLTFSYEEILNNDRINLNYFDLISLEKL